MYDDLIDINKCLIFNSQSNVRGFELLTFQISIFYNRQNLDDIERCEMCGYGWYMRAVLNDAVHGV